MDPSTTVEWLSVSGTGIFLNVFRARLEGVAPKESHHVVVLDDSWSLLAMSPDIYLASDFGLTSVGLYNLGAKSVYVDTWDTTNNIYQLRAVTSAARVPFRNSLSCKLQNTNATDTATMRQDVEYALYVASKRLLMYMSPYYAKNKSLPWVKGKLASANIQPSAVTFQWVGRWTEGLAVEPEIEPLYEKSEGRLGKMYALIEVFVPDEVSTEQILEALRYAKVIKEEVV